MVNSISKVSLCLGTKDNSHGGNILESCSQVNPALFLPKFRMVLAETQRLLDTSIFIRFSTSKFLKAVQLYHQRPEKTSGVVWFYPSFLFLFYSCYRPLLTSWQSNNAAGLNKCQFNFYTVSMPHFWRWAKAQVQEMKGTKVPQNGPASVTGY